MQMFVRKQDFRYFCGVMKVLVTPLNWGLGHATRCIPLVRQRSPIGRRRYESSPTENGIPHLANFRVGSFGAALFFRQ